METSNIEMIGRYRVQEKLGAGGMAIVYKGLDTTLERYVAIKLILPNRRISRVALERFKNEARTLAKLQHPNIVKILDYGEHENSPYMVMEFISGGTLTNKIGRPMHWKQAARLLAPIARALEASHQHNIIHRDIKPANILLNQAGQPMLADFGIVKLFDTRTVQELTATGAIIGTPRYMSPEQCLAGEIDFRSDIYAMGIVFFEMITGRAPFTGTTTEIIIKQISEPLPDPRGFVRDMPEEVAWVIRKALEKNPENRFQSMAEFAQLLEAIAEGQEEGLQLTAETGTAPADIRHRFRRRAFFIAAAGLLTVVAVVIGLLLLRGDQDAETALGTATANFPTTVILTDTGTPTFEPSATLVEELAAPLPSETPIPSATTEEIELPTSTLAAPTVDSAVTQKLITIRTINQVTLLKRVERVSVIDLTWSDDSSRVIDSGAKGLYLIDPVSGALDLFETGYRIDRVTLSPDGSLLATLTERNTVVLWNPTDLIEVRSLMTNDSIRSIAFSPDSTQIALGLLDGHVEVWDIQSNLPVFDFSGNFGNWGVAFSPDSTYLAAGSSTGVLMWNVTDRTWFPIMTGQQDYIRWIQFSPDSQTLAAAAGSLVRMWRVSDGEEIQAIDGHGGTNVNCIAFSPDGSILASAADDHLVKLWNVDTGQILRTFQDFTSPVYSVAFSHDGKYLAAGANEGVVLIWGLP